MEYIINLSVIVIHYTNGSVRLFSLKILTELSWYIPIATEPICNIPTVFMTLSWQLELIVQNETVEIFSLYILTTARCIIEKI